MRFSKKNNNFALQYTYCPYWATMGCEIEKKHMENIIQPIDRKLIAKELESATLLRVTSRGGNQIYVTTAKQSPNIMMEIARLRETAFRFAGGGGGKSYDMDEFDTMETPYKQLFVWDPDACEILGGYRYICGSDIRFNEKGQPKLSTAEMFHFSDKYIKEYLPRMFELGRSFVHPDYQSSKMGAKSMYAMNNLWDGLGAVAVHYQVEYCFGKVTFYPNYLEEARDLIFCFLEKFYPDKDHLIRPIDPFPVHTCFTPQQVDEMFVGKDLRENYRILNTEVRKMGVNIPPLVNAYMGLSPVMRTFGSAVCHSFGNLIEVGMMIPISQLYEDKRALYIGSYHPAK